MGRNPSDQRPTDCICPKCGKKHSKLLNWTGRGTPRFYCNLCKGVVAGRSNPYIPTMGYGKV